LTGVTIGALAVDPGNPQVVYAGTGSGVYKSTNGGGTWNLVNGGLDITSVHSLVIVPTNPQTVYVGAYNGVYKSTNGGASWSVASNGLSINSYVRSLSVDPTNPQIVYAGSDAGVYKSTDGGSSWTTFNTGLSSLPISSLVIDPSAPQTIYAGTGVGVFKFASGSNSWIPVNNGIPDNSLIIDLLVICPGNPQTIYSGTVNGVYKSVTGGGSWSAVNSGLSYIGVDSLVVDPVNPQAIYAGAGIHGVFKSIDGGVTWDTASKGIKGDGRQIMTLAIDPLTPQTLYAGTMNTGVFKSINGGETWSVVNGGLNNLGMGLFIDAIAIDPSAPQTVYAGSQQGAGVFKSTNGGGYWSAVNTGLTDQHILSLVLDPVNPQILYAGTWFGGVFKSTDGGSSWNAASTGLSNLSVWALGIDPVTPLTLYAGTSGGIFKSQDGGSTWYSVNNNIYYNTHISSLAIDRNAPQTVYAATDRGVYKTIDGGDTWTPLNNGLTGMFVNTIVIDSKDHQNVYAGTSSIGVFKGLFLPYPTIGGTPPATAVVGDYYSFTPVTTNAGSFSISGNISGIIPPGLNFDTTTGTLSGVPTFVSNFDITYNNIVITAFNENSSGLVSLPAFNIILKPIRTTIYTMPGNPSNSSTASFTFGSTWPNPTFECRLDGGSFMACVSPAYFTGLSKITHTFQVRAISQSGTPDPNPASYTWKIEVNPVVISSATSLKSATYGVNYSTTLAASGGAKPFTWAVISGGLPDGITLNAANGALKGKPTGWSDVAFTAKVTDKYGNTALKGFTLSILVPQMTITTPSLPNGKVGVSYKKVLAAKGGVKPYTWSVSSGVLPGGLALDPVTGTISGTPLSAGSYSFTIQLADGRPEVVTKDVTLVVK
jgi:photosystem II stability/assembly factor-like uncharacterized protein